MKEENIKELVKNFGELERLVVRYDQIAADIMHIESEETELLTEKVEQRDELIEDMDKIKSMCTILIDSFEPKESEIIRNMLKGENTNQRISDEFAPIKSAVLSLISAQTHAAQTDKELRAQFASRTREAKENLVKLKNDKKKLDYYASVNNAGKLGGDLDSSF